MAPDDLIDQKRAPLMLRVVRDPNGLRVYVFGHRWHHGLSGLLAIIAGLAAVVHDWHDRPWLAD